MAQIIKKILAYPVVILLKVLHVYLYPSSRKSRWKRIRGNVYRRFSDRIGNIFSLLSIDELSAPVNGKRIWFLSRDSWAVRQFFRFRANYDKEQIELLKGFITKKSCFWDIGANYGVYSISLIDSFSDSNKIVLLEPSPDIFNVLKKSIDYNKKRGIDVHLLNCAAGDKKSSGELHLSSMSSADARVYTPDDNDLFNLEKKRETLSIDIKSLDQLAQELFGDWPVDNIIKLDVQGFEFDVLEGAVNLIENSKKTVVFIELWPHGLKQCMKNPQELLDYFKDRGFKIMDESGNKREYDRFYNFFDNQLKDGKTESINAFFIKPERLDN